MRRWILEPGSSRKAAPLGATVVSFPGCHSAITGPFSIPITASRTIDVVPGIKSAAFTHAAAATFTGSEYSAGVLKRAGVESVCDVHKDNFQYRVGQVSTAVGKSGAGNLGLDVARLFYRRPAGCPFDDHIDVAGADRVLPFDRGTGG